MANEEADIVRLRQLVMLYCRGCDRRDFALVRSLYHDDAIDDHGAMFKGTPDAFVAWLPEIMAKWQLTRHSISNSLFAVSGDKAEGEHYVEAWHSTGGDRAREFIAYGRYLDRYEKRQGIWKFAHRQLVFDHGFIREIDVMSLQRMGEGVQAGRIDRQDPSWSYELLSSHGRSMSA